jgi:acyl-CoA synthetase (NDP forming)
MSRRIISLLGTFCVLASVLTVALAQEATKEAKPSLKAKGRLPAYYKDVVSDTQKQQIYGIQAKYNEQILKLAEEMKALTAQRDKEVEAVLSADQKTKVETLRAEAAKKKGTSDKPESTEAKPEKAAETTTSTATPAKSASGK